MEAENVDEEKISGRAAAESVDEEFGRVASTRNEDPLPKLDEIKTTETQTDEADGQSKDKLALAIAQLQASIVSLTTVITNSFANSHRASVSPFDI